MQSVLSRIWTRVAVSISYNDNHYTTGTFIFIYIYIYIYNIYIYIYINKIDNLIWCSDQTTSNEWGFSSGSQTWYMVCTLACVVLFTWSFTYAKVRFLGPQRTVLSEGSCLAWFITCHLRCPFLEECWQACVSLQPCACFPHTNALVPNFGVCGAHRKFS